MRILPTEQQSIKSLKELGYSNKQIERLEHAMIADSGLILTAGEVNSGKSTMQAAMLKKIRALFPSKNIVEVGSPIEYSIEGIIQHPIHTTVEMSEAEMTLAYSRAMAQFLRSDAEIFCINEIRNKDTAIFTQSAVQSGHLFISTIHAQSALHIINRLVSLNLDREILCSPGFIRLLIHQSLVAIVCKHCAMSYKDAIQLDNFQAILGRLHKMCEIYGLHESSLENLKFRNGNGCEHCHKGVAGLTVVAEMVMPTGKLLTLLNDNKFIDAYLCWRHSGERTLKEDAILKVLNGLVCPTSLEQRLGAIDDTQMLDLLDSQFIKTILYDADIKESYNVV